VTANHDLRSATARVREARALRGVAAADRYPTVNTNGEYQRAQISRNSPFTSGDPKVLDRGPKDLYQLGFDASWELDLFGRVRRYQFLVGDAPTLPMNDTYSPKSLVSNVGASPPPQLMARLTL
jgi:Outer membrane protein